MTKNRGRCGRIKEFLNENTCKLIHLFGTKCCILTTLLVACIVASLIVAKWMEPIDSLKIAVLSSLIILFLFGLLGMAGLACFALKTTQFTETLQNEDEEEVDYINVHFIHRLQILLLGIFAMGSVGHDLLKIVDISRCLHEINNDLRRTSLAYECIKLLFELAQIYFIAHFWRYRCKTDIARFLLGLIFAANLCIWFYVLVTESLHTWNHKTIHTDPYVHQDITEADTDPSNSTPCKNGTTRTSEMLDLWQPYLYPLTMEFCLMATGLLGTMWNMKRETVVKNEPARPSIQTLNDAPKNEVHLSQPGQPELPEIMVHKTPSSSSDGNKKENNAKDYTDENTPLCQSKQTLNVAPKQYLRLKQNAQPKLTDTNKPEATSSPSDHNTNETDMEDITSETETLITDPPSNFHQKSNTKIKERTCPELFYLATLLSITVFFLAAADQGDLWIGYCWIYMFLHLFLLFSSVIACYQMRKMPTKPEQFGPDQILLLVSTGTLLLLTLLELIPPLANIPSPPLANITSPPLANITSKDDCEKILIATDFFLLISVFLQTSMLLKECKMPDSGNQWLRRCFSCMAVLNFYMWLEDSIYAQKLDSTLYTVHHRFYDSMTWTVCKLILMPPCIFYRIHVAEMCFERFHLV